MPSPELHVPMERLSGRTRSPLDLVVAVATVGAAVGAILGGLWSLEEGVLQATLAATLAALCGYYVGAYIGLLGCFLFLGAIPRVAAACFVLVLVLSLVASVFGD